MKRLAHIINSINDRFIKERQSNPQACYHRITVEFNHILFEASISDIETVVEVMNPRHYSRCYDNISCYIESRIICWDDVEIEKSDYWDAHGFASEADYNRYRYAI